jgi:hypothetical protein
MAQPYLAFLEAKIALLQDQGTKLAAGVAKLQGQLAEVQARTHQHSGNILTMLGEHLMTDNPFQIARQRMERRRIELVAEGILPGAASWAVEWAMGIAAKKYNPETDTQTFLLELDRKLAICHRHAQGVMRSAQ